MSIRDFIKKHYRHFNAGELSRCTESLRDFLGSGGRLMLTLAGAMSTAEIGKSLAPAIREQRIHAICCTGANLEEELFGLVSRSEYEMIPNWREQSKEDDAQLSKRKMNRVTDVAIPEKAFVQIGEKLFELWEEAEFVGDSRFPHEYVYDLLLHGDLEISSPSIEILPDFRFNNPSIAFIAVDLPAPFGPRIATISPLLTLIVHELIISGPSPYPPVILFPSKNAIYFFLPK